MFDSVIQEAASRFGLSTEKAQSLVQMVLAYVTWSETGGLSGLVDKFKSAGLGSVMQSWMGGDASTAQPVSGEQLQQVLGGSGGLIGMMGSKLGLSGDTAGSALSFVLPVIIGKLTPDGSLPTSLPQEIMGYVGQAKDWVMDGLADGAGAALAGATAVGGAALAGAGAVGDVAKAGVSAVSGAALAGAGAVGDVAKAGVSAVSGAALAGADAVGDVAKAGVGVAADAMRSAGDAAAAGAAATADAAKSVGNRLWKWLPWVVLAAAAAYLLSQCSGTPSATKDVAGSAVSAVTAAAGDAASGVKEGVSAMKEGAATGAEAVKDSANAMKEGAGAVAEAAAGAVSGAAVAVADAIPAGAGVLAAMFEGAPSVKVYFDTGKAAVAADFAERARPVVDYLKANPNAKAVVSGFNDPTGNAAVNAELSKKRAQAVAAALKTAGVADGAVLLEKPAQTTDTGASNAESRRVEVVIRK